MISKELQEVWSGKKKDIVIETVEIFHEGSSLREFFCKAASELSIVLEDGTSQTFSPSNFIVSHAKQGEDGHMEMTITFGLVGFKTIEKLEDIIKNYEDNIIIYYRIYTENNLRAPQTSLPFKFTVENVAIAGETISVTGSLLINVNEMTPTELYTFDKFPMLKSLQ